MTQAIWLLAPIETSLLHEPTLIRLLIQYMYSVTLSAAPQAGKAAAGVIRWSGDPDTAAGIVPADLPEPIDDANADWAWHTWWPFASRTNVTLNLLPGQAVIDVSSMRKLSNTEGLLLCVNSDALDVSFSIGTRFLLKQ